MRWFLLLIVLSVSLSLSAQNAAEAKPEAPRIAVLRLEDALTAYKKYTTAMDQLKKDVAESKAQINALDERLKQLDSQLQVMKPDSENYVKQVEEFEVTKLKEKLLVERGNSDIDKRRAVLVKESYASLRTALQAFCQERGIKIVHLAPNPELQAANNKDLNQQLFAQSVLYFDPSLDITEAFIPYLNERWSAEGASKGADGGGTTGQPAGK
jgi:Skp family chaperone for outer membrane proteins